jgi:3-hydroxyacyl-[acyl-carrier-protein] dehydratase
MLNNHLYTIVSSEKLEGINHVEVALHADDIIYRSHFPGNPITPGVCIIQMLKELVEMMEERLYMIHEVKNVKFLKIINPVENNRIEFFITCNNEADTLQVSAEIKHKEETFAKLNLLLTEWHP